VRGVTASSQRVRSDSDEQERTYRNKSQNPIYFNIIMTLEECRGEDYKNEKAITISTVLFS